MKTIKRPRFGQLVEIVLGNQTTPQLESLTREIESDIARIQKGDRKDKEWLVARFTLELKLVRDEYTDRNITPEIALSFWKAAKQLLIPELYQNILNAAKRIEGNRHAN